MVLAPEMGPLSIVCYHIRRDITKQRGDKAQGVAKLAIFC